MSIWVTGDTHGDFRRFSTGNFPVQREMTKNDVVIICGDFGGVWNYKDENKNEKYWLDWLDSKPFTVAFVDGNHENFDRIYSYPAKEWNGGKVHEIRPSVLHLMRGEVFTIENKVDYILTHCAAASTVALMGQGLYEQDKLTEYLEKIRVSTDFKRWYFGHYHDERQINDKEILLYEKIVRIC